MQNAINQLPKYIWYASYGSNLRARRFRAYLEGGSIAGNNRVLPPCLDPTPPLKSDRIHLPFQMYFGGESRAWGGGVAFIRRENKSMTISRAYLITLDQFRHVVGQENRMSHPADLQIIDAMRDGSSVVPEAAGQYDELIYCGERDSHPVFTFTSSSGLPVNRPAAAYLANVITGLDELAIDPGDIIHYLAQSPGVKDDYTASELDSLVTDTVSPGWQLLGMRTDSVS